VQGRGGVPALFTRADPTYNKRKSEVYFTKTSWEGGGGRGREEFTLGWTIWQKGKKIEKVGMDTRGGKG